jgi:nucleotide-binding universal stress UspA family protein
MCAIDLTPESVPLIEEAAKLGRDFGAKVRLVHAVPALGGRPERYFDVEFHRFLTDTAREEIRKLQNEAGTNFDVCMEGGDVSKVVRDAAMHHEADLVMIGRGHAQAPFGNLRSNTYAVIRDAPCPVLSM